MKSSITPVALAIVAGLLLSGCNDNNNTKTDLIIKDHENVYKAQGIWHKQAYGEILSISSGQVKSYEFNSQACTLTNDNSYQKMMQEHIDTLNVIGTDFLRIQEKGSPTSYTLKHIEQLPASCQTPITKNQATSPSQVFQYFWHTFNDYYAFFDLRDVDWQAQYDSYAPLINDNMNDDALFKILSEMVAPLQDAHVSIESDTQSFNSMKPAPVLRSALGKARSYLRFGLDVDISDVITDTLDDYQHTTASYITTDSLKSFPHDDDSKTLLWGVTPNNVGILVINNMAQYHQNPNATEKQQQQAAKQLIDKVLKEFENTDGLILDIRNNLGGDDAIALTLATHFASENKLAFKKQAVNKSGLGHTTVTMIKKPTYSYTKPVYMLTSQITVSAGEVFAMAMKQFPHVTQVGEETSGAFSDILNFTLPNGWEIGLSNEVYHNAQGENFEKRGLQPDVNISAFSNLETDLPRFATYDYALEAMGKPATSDLSVADFEQQAQQLIKQSGLPGLAVAVIKNGQIKYANGFGIADEQNTPVTADTPFYIASVSKTLVGATLAHAVAQKTVSLDEPVAPILPFTTNVIPAQKTPITLRHLVTHTSGIIDSDPAYLCSYYLHDTKQNISDALLGTSKCDEQINTDLQQYLNNYLNRTGRFYQDANFSSQYGFETAQVYIYSNIATALAAYTLEQKSNTPFIELVQDYVFTPLNMTNSSWATGKPSANVATRFVHNPQTDERSAMPSYGSITYADGSAISTVNDLARFLIASMNKGKIDQQQVLSQAAVEAMLSPQTDTPVPSRDIGYFWDLDGSYIHHNGSDPGVMSQVIGDLKTKNAIIMLSNGDENYEPHDHTFYMIKNLALKLVNSN
ncbi:D-aminopeptidase [Pseudoalteromonas holothuriae]|uniref:D-aminopeptidase n=1 Tax=Pseudoalteromonas holothuriae TaxID=2963714 RepID=A0A9W4R2W4_9GAMM|nr:MULTISPECIES: serine hydrolase [unclassified Pseudoalteromonas]CAH9064455.1 D-aminopeptidase [Pseudoalteromonas sp. CIP111854]CAH9065408.1 D-aminopeptidase [Pseudoalteromonas sp. CIP111951]